MPNHSKHYHARFLDPVTAVTQVSRRNGIDPAATTPIPRVDATLHLSAQTLNWLTQRPHARALVNSVWDTLTELLGHLTISGSHRHRVDSTSSVR